MRWFQVTFQNNSLEQKTTVQVSEDSSVLDAAKETRLNLPMPCRTGDCNVCVGKLLAGVLDQTEQLLLDDAQIADGYALLCCSYALSDCTIAVDWKGGILKHSAHFIRYEQSSP